jgi:hypothetical protein
MNLNEQLQQAYEAGRQAALNEQQGSNQIAVTYITWLLSQGLITQEQYLELYNAIAAGNADWILISGMFAQYVRKFLQDNPGLIEPTSPGGDAPDDDDGGGDDGGGGWGHGGGGWGHGGVPPTRLA